jgi:hypothetical protein
MRSRRSTVSGITASSAAAVVLALAAPASAARAPSPECTFAKGLTTCVTTTYATETWGPTTTVGTADGSLPYRWCILNSGPQYVYYGTSNAVLTQTLVTTTTVVRKGAPQGHGKVVSRTSTTAPLGDPHYVSGLLSCSDGPF